MTSIGSGPGIGSGSQFEINPARAVAAPAAVAPAAAAATPTPSATTIPATSGHAATAVSGTLGTGGASIDTDRVEAISKAIKSGNYPLIPTKIGDAMIAAGVMLRTAS